jgi:PKD repeat protein
VRYAYDTPGTHSVKLKVTDQAGQIDAASHSIQISPVVEVEPPTAVIDGPTLGETGQRLAFDGSLSQAGTAAITSLEWEMGDGAVLTGATVRYAYDVAGAYNVRLTVTDQAGLSDTATQSVQITPVEEVDPPTAVISGPTLGETGERLSFDGSQSSAGTAAIERYDWDMGDGTALSGAAVKHIYDEPGTYSVSLTVTDKAGLSGTTTHSIQITPAEEVVPPKAVIDGPGLGETGEALSFDGSGSRPGTAAIASYDWDLGDGSTLSGPMAQHAYSAPGSYDVLLEVTDEAGLSGSTAHMVQINPAVQVVPPKAAIDGPQVGAVGEPVTFSAAGSQQGTAAIAGYIWQSGDGNDTGEAPDETFRTIYASPGTYHPVVTVVDANGLSDSASMAIVVNASLEGTSWILAGTNPGTSITLEFANGTLTGFAGCNSYDAAYTSSKAGGGSNVISVGPISVTGRLCSEEIMGQEQAYLASLQTASSYTIDGTSLTLATADGALTYGAVTAAPAAR